jgi:hypothetical protein
MATAFLSSEMFPGSIRLDKTTPRLAMMFVSDYD